METKRKSILQCLWRADQLKLLGIEICWDFKLWEHRNILACPFLEPITEAEVDLYQSYLAQKNVYDDEDDFYTSGCQDYEEIKETNQKISIFDMNWDIFSYLK